MHFAAEMCKINTLIIANELLLQLLLLLLVVKNIALGANVVHHINPYEKVLKILLKQPPVDGGGGGGGGSWANTSHPHVRDYVAEKWLQQKVDHFSDNTKGQEKHWMMRYYANTQFYQPNGPIFIMVGGEWEINANLLQQGHFVDMAQQHRALMFYTEHRYYGKSWPKRGASMEGLKYLNVLQALEDLRHFIEYQQSLLSYKAKVVLVGGSYSGSMVTWFMKMYPDMADVAWASSAPLVAKINFYEYMNLAMQSIQEKGGAKCSRSLEQAFKGLHRKLHSSQSEELLQSLYVCSRFNVTNEIDISALFNALGNYFAAVVQSQSSQIPKICQSFLTLDANPTEALVKYIRWVFLPTTEEEDQGERLPEDEEYCLDVSYEGMRLIFDENQDIYTGTRCWFYQTCHEFGWFPTTTTAVQHFSSPHYAASPFAGQVSLKFYQNLCQDVFSSPVDTEVNTPLTFTELHSRAETINQIFGGLTNVSQRVIFTHGLMDPWRAVGMQHGKNVLLLRDYSHVEDLGSINLRDTVEMNVAKLKVAAFINKALFVKET